MDPWQQPQSPQGPQGPPVPPVPPAQSQPGQPLVPTSPTPIPVQQPEVYNASSVPTTPYGMQPPLASSNNQRGGTKPVPNKLFIVAGAGLGLVVVLGIVLVILSSGGSKTPTNQNQQSQTTVQSPSLVPAQSVEIEQINNAISQDLSQIDDEKDFPSNSLEDQTLGL
ncbi:MAG: hypothetical protein ACR2FM_04375 [Candidatus Saccharimonadales bacterium]